MGQGPHKCTQINENNVVMVFYQNKITFVLNFVFSLGRIVLYLCFFPVRVKIVIG